MYIYIYIDILIYIYTNVSCFVQQNKPGFLCGLYGYLRVYLPESISSFVSTYHLLYSQGAEQAPGGAQNDQWGVRTVKL